MRTKNRCGEFANWTGAQAAHVLKLISDKGLNVPDGEDLNLYLPALIEAIKKGTLSGLPDFRRAIGLDLDVANPHLRLLSGDHPLTIPATTGKRTIARAKHVFAGYIDHDFIALDVASPRTDIARVTVHEMVQNGTFAAIFAGVSARFTQDQVIAFVEAHAKWLHPEGWATFLPFSVDGKDFVAGVAQDSIGWLRVGVSRLSFAYAWDVKGRYRVVLPQRDASDTLS